MQLPPTLRYGSTGSYVRQWQEEVGATVDGVFGIRTQQATRVWQSMHGLAADGVVGPLTWAEHYRTRDAKDTEPGYAFIRAKHFGAGGMHVVKLIVIHTMEWGETIQTAESCGIFFQNPIGPKGPVIASAHYGIDVDSIVQYVSELDVAYHTPGFVQGVEVNRIALGIEHAGYAAQTPAQWADAYSSAMLERSAMLVSELCKRYEIPARRLSDAALVAGEKGIVGHADCTRALKTGSHWDPGPNFPWNAYLERIATYLGGS